MKTLAPTDVDTIRFLRSKQQRVAMIMRTYGFGTVDALFDAVLATVVHKDLVAAPAAEPCQVAAPNWQVAFTPSQVAVAELAEPRVGAPDVLVLLPVARVAEIVGARPAPLLNITETVPPGAPPAVSTTADQAGTAAALLGETGHRPDGSDEAPPLREVGEACAIVTPANTTGQSDRPTHSACQPVEVVRHDREAAAPAEQVVRERPAAGRSKPAAVPVVAARVGGDGVPARPAAHLPRSSACPVPVGRGGAGAPAPDAPARIAVAPAPTRTPPIALIEPPRERAGRPPAPPSTGTSARDLAAMAERALADGAVRITRCPTAVVAATPDARIDPADAAALRARSERANAESTAIHQARSKRSHRSRGLG